MTADVMRVRMCVLRETAEGKEDLETLGCGRPVIVRALERFGEDVGLQMAARLGLTTA